jgi:hypothetical protein
MMPTSQVAALFVSSRSIYRHMPGVLAYGERENALTFSANLPGVAHPPCRTWSKFLRHMAKPKDLLLEQHLGVWAVETIQKCGGVVEQPAGSMLWERCKLPRPNDLSNPFLYTLAVEQSWWGYGTRKPTWLLVCGVPPAQLPPVPFRLVGNAGTTNGMGRAERSRTVRPFAEWLCQVARSTWWQFR